jgi:hypothetical protein
MDRRRFMTTSLTGLSAAWAGDLVFGVRGQESEDFASLDDSAHLPALSSDENVKAPCRPIGWSRLLGSRQAFIGHCPRE